MNGSTETGAARLALYHETWAEIARLRDYEWRITYYFVTLAAALIVFSLNEQVKPLLSCGVLWSLTFIQVVALALGLVYLSVTHAYLTQQRNIRRSIEEVLQFYELHVHAEQPLLPPQWKGVRITSSFQRVGLLFPLMVTIIVAYGLSIYVMWAMSYR